MNRILPLIALVFCGTAAADDRQLLLELHNRPQQLLHGERVPVESVALGQLAQDPDWRVQLSAKVVLAWRQMPQQTRAVVQLRPHPTPAPRLGKRYYTTSPLPPEVLPVLAWRVLYQPQSSAPLTSSLAAMYANRAVEESPEFLLELLLAHPDPPVRHAMVMSLAKAPVAVAQKGFVFAFADPDPLVRQAAVVASSRHSSAQLYVAQWITLLVDADPGVRAKSARSLGWYGKGYIQLRPLLADNSAEVRLQALRAMEKIDADATGALPEIHQLAQDSDSRVIAVVERLRR